MTKISNPEVQALKEFVASFPKIERALDKVLRGIPAEKTTAPKVAVRPKAKAKPKAPPRDLVLAALTKANKGLSLSVLIDQTGLTPHTVKSELRKLEELNKATRRGETKATTWWLERRAPREPAVATT